MSCCHSDLIRDLLEIYCDDEKKTEAIASSRGKGYDGVSQGLRPHVRDDTTMMYRILNAASEERILKCFKNTNCMPIVVNEEAAAVPAAEEPDALNNYALDYDITNAIGGLRIELSVGDDANTRGDFSGTVFLGSGVNFPTEDIVKAWNNQDENDYQ